MTDFGPNTALVEEVIELAERAPLLTPATQLSAAAWLIVDTLAEAREYAYRRSTGASAAPNDDEGGGMTWTDLRERESGKCLGVTYRNAEMAPWRAAYDELDERFFDSLSRLAAEHRALAEDISADLANIALCRAVFGADPERLFEKMFQAYRAGGWPCGWVGAYPAGKLVVYDPTSRKTA